MPFKVRVRDFQSIEDAEIVIEGLTVVTGTNNAGKSAFFRALRGALTNARGSDFVRHGKSHCTVDVEDLDSGHKLTWEKGAKVNRYVVDGKRLDRVGHGVPPEARLFGVESVSAGNSELWPQIAPQITGVSFLLHEPGPVIAEAVADVDRVNHLSRALKACESDRRGAASSLKTRREDASVLEKRREAFSGLDETVENLAALEKRHAGAARTAKAYTNLAKLRGRHVTATEAVERLEGLESVEGLVPSEERVVEAREAQREVEATRSFLRRRGVALTEVQNLTGLEQVDSLLPSEERMDYVEKFRQALGLTVDLALRLDGAREERDRAQEVEEALQEMRLDDEPVARAQKLRKALAGARVLVRRRDDLRREVETLEGELAEREADLVSVTSDAEEILATYEECPTCGGALDHAH